MTSSHLQLECFPSFSLQLCPCRHPSDYCNKMDDFSEWGCVNMPMDLNKNNPIYIGLIHCSKHLRFHSLDFGYFHPPKEFSNGQNIMLLSTDLSNCTLMLISRLKLRMQSKPWRNSPTPEIGLKCCLTQQYGAFQQQDNPERFNPTYPFFHS